MSDDTKKPTLFAEGLGMSSFRKSVSTGDIVQKGLGSSALRSAVQNVQTNNQSQANAPSITETKKDG